ncbi:GNAT family N-acetyltransferase [Glutamicibacter sp.]|uniref:GNAT family N-acetyltransferase n=1 Tax=Glutamicibacter sp. TaxID=1931995 RepID=UPI0028BEE289|nr:GNAT family N-acetyltransferase [Glutamicibacter sp.]
MPELNDYRIRVASLEDVRPALEMKLEAWRQAYKNFRDEDFFLFHEQQLEAQVAWWERGLASGAQFIIAENTSGEIIGLAGGTPSIDEDQDAGVDIELGMLYILEDHYGSGLGGHLLDVVLGQRPALLWVLEGNDRAIAFYRKHGFEFDGTSEELTGSWRGLTELRMVRRNG